MLVRLLVFGLVGCVGLACRKTENGSSEGKSEPARGEEAMILTLSSGDKVVNPTDEEIREILLRLDVSRDGEGFAILGRDKMTYIQVGGDKTIGFDMEYQEGDVQRHYRAKREDWPLDEVVRALSQYRDGTIDWTHYGNWSQITW